MIEKEIDFKFKITTGDVYRAVKGALGDYVCRKLCLNYNDDNEALNEPVFKCPNKVVPAWHNEHQQRLFLLPEDNIPDSPSSTYEY